MESERLVPELGHVVEGAPCFEEAIGGHVHVGVHTWKNRAEMEWECADDCPHATHDEQEGTARGSLPVTGRTPEPTAAVEADAFVCRWTPSTCMDDLCRNSSVGICGNVDDDPEEDDELDDHWGPCCETGECDD